MSSEVPTRMLAKTGVRVPIVGFGTAAAGNRLRRVDAVRLFEEALHEGITYFDTAPEFAGYGKAQEYLGYVLRERRKEIFLVTKCFAPHGSDALKILERSLKELQTDYADLVFVHSLGDDRMDPRIVFSRDGTYAALMKAKTQGATRFVGFSGHNRPDRFVQALRHYEVDVLLNAVNPVDRHTYNFERQVWPAAARNGIGLLAMKIFGGQLEGKRTELSHCRMPREHQDLAFRYALSLPQIACAVIGMATREELHQNLARAKNFLPLSSEEEDFLERLGKQLAGDWGAHLGAVV